MSCKVTRSKVRLQRMGGLTSQFSFLGSVDRPLLLLMMMCLVCCDWYEIYIFIDCLFYPYQHISNYFICFLRRYFPYCKLGDKCLFGHPLCRYDALCIKADCPFSHFSRNANKVSSTQNGEASSSSLAKPGSTATANNTNDANSDQRSSKAFKSRYVAPNLVKSKIYRA